MAAFDPWLAERCLNIAGLSLYRRLFVPNVASGERRAWGGNPAFETAPGRYLIDVFGYLSGDPAGQRVLIAGKSEYKIAKPEKSVPTENMEYDPLGGK